MTDSETAKRYPTHGSVSRYLGLEGLGSTSFAAHDENSQILHFIAVIGPPDCLQQLAMRHCFVAIYHQVAPADRIPSA